MSVLDDILDNLPENEVVRTVSQGATFRQIEGVQLLTLSRKGAII